MINKIQNLQDQTTKISLPKELKNKNSRQRLKQMNWLSIEKEIESATHKQTYRILNWKIPEEIAVKMPMNSNSMRMQTNQKLATKPEMALEKQDKPSVLQKSRLLIQYSSERSHSTEIIQRL